MDHHFIHPPNKSKFKGTVRNQGTIYEYTLYFLPLTEDKLVDEIATFFGNRVVKGESCLGITEEIVKRNIFTNNLSAFIIVHERGTHDYASASLQLFNWCLPGDNGLPNIQVFLNDLCRTKYLPKVKTLRTLKTLKTLKTLRKTKTRTKKISNQRSTVSPVKILFQLAEQLAVQNLNKEAIHLFIATGEPGFKTLFDLYQTKYGFRPLADCVRMNEGLMAMEKTGLRPKRGWVDFSFLVGLKVKRNL